MKNLVFTLLFLSACAGSFELARASRTPAPETREKAPRASASMTFVDCVALDNKRRWETLAAQGGAALSGAGGLSALPIKDETARTIVLISSGVIAAVSVAVGIFAAEDGEKWARECGQ